MSRCRPPAPAPPPTARLRQAVPSPVPPLLSWQEEGEQPCTPTLGTWPQELGVRRQRASIGQHRVSREGDMPLPASPRLLLTLLNAPGVTLPSPSLRNGARSFGRHRAHSQSLANAGGSLAWHLLPTPPAAPSSMARLSLEMRSPGRRNEWQKEPLCAREARWGEPRQNREGEEY